MRALRSLPVLCSMLTVACGTGIGGNDRPGGLAGGGGAGGNGEATAGAPGSGGAVGLAGSGGTGGESAEGGGGAVDHTPDPFPLDMPYTGKYAAVDSLAGDALVEKLCEIVTQGYESMSYSAARQVVLLQTDNHNGQVRGVYDGFWHDPTHSEINIEHTWPQSKGADVLPAKSDIHHLFPVQANFNSARSNLPFGEVVVRDWPDTLQGDPDCTDAMPGNADGCYSIKGKDAFDVEVFEPRDGHKGDAARAVFYFSVRYGDSCQVKSLSVFDPVHPAASEEVLKKWNLHDPPSDHERQRNDIIEVEQGVRNPFIDHPELVDRVSFQ